MKRDVIKLVAVMFFSGLGIAIVEMLTGAQLVIDGPSVGARVIVGVAYAISIAIISNRFDFLIERLNQNEN